MTRLWKRKAHEYLLVLTVLILIQTGWTFDEHEPRKLNVSPNTLNSNELSYVEIVVGTTADAGTLQYYLSRWNYSSGEVAAETNITYYGEGLPDVLFHSSAENASLTLKDLTRCMNDFGFVTCLKFMLVNRLDNLLDYLKGNNLTETDFSFGNGIVSFKSVPGVNGYDGRGSGAVGLDEDITRKVMELFKDRSLKLNFLPGVGLDVKPSPGKSPGQFIGFKARPYLKWQFWRNGKELLSLATPSDVDDAEENEGRSGNNKRKKKKGGFQMPSMMILPQLIMWGFMPFALANLQAMVMNAFMLNMMALNSAIFMTIRNLVFGPRGGPKIKYVNYGYRKKKKSNVPTIIVHSPAAFVKQPFHLIHHRKKPIHHHHDHHDHDPPHFPHPTIYHDDPPPSFHHSVEPDLTNHGESYDEYPEESRNRGVEVLGDEGELDGKNRVRIRINEGTGPSVKEVLHRIRTIENLRNRFNPSTENDYQEFSHTGYSESFPSSYPSLVDNTPWTVSRPNT